MRTFRHLALLGLILVSSSSVLARANSGLNGRLVANSMSFLPECGKGWVEFKLGGELTRVSLRSVAPIGRVIGGVLRGGEIFTTRAIYQDGTFETCSENICIIGNKKLRSIQSYGTAGCDLRSSSSFEVRAQLFLVM